MSDGFSFTCAPWPQLRHVTYRPRSVSSGARGWRRLVPQLLHVSVTFRSNSAGWAAVVVMTSGWPAPRTYSDGSPGGAKCRGCLTTRPAASARGVDSHRALWGPWVLGRRAAPRLPARANARGAPGGEATLRTRTGGFGDRHAASYTTSPRCPARAAPPHHHARRGRLPDRAPSATSAPHRLGQIADGSGSVGGGRPPSGAARAAWPSQPQRRGRAPGGRPGPAPSFARCRGTFAWLRQTRSADRAAPEPNGHHGALTGASRIESPRPRSSGRRTGDHGH